MPLPSILTNYIVCSLRNRIILQSFQVPLYSSQAPHGSTCHSFRLSRCSGLFNKVYTQRSFLAPGVLIFYLQALFQHSGLQQPFSQVYRV